MHVTPGKKSGKEVWASPSKVMLLFRDVGEGRHRGESVSFMMVEQGEQKCLSELPWLPFQMLK